MDEKIQKGVSGRIEVTRNCGNYNQVKVALEGEKDEIALQMPSFIALLKGLSMGVDDELGTGGINRSTTGDSEPSGATQTDTTDHKPTTSYAKGDGEAAEIEPYPNKRPIDPPPIDTGELFRPKDGGEPRRILECTWCQKRNTEYISKGEKSKGKLMWSCGKDYGGCGAWYPLEDKEDK